MGSCFNPRPRVGGDDGVMECLSRLQVSIHAPAWGATYSDTLGNVDPMFQSTPPRGGRRDYPAKRTATNCFNPRPRVGGDETASKLPFTLDVSIHAPAWGATKPLQNFPSPLMFQSTPPRGGRPIIPFKMADPTEFQSTPPRGGRQGLRVERYRPGVSIHAPAWGATALTHRIHPRRIVSIHAPAWGATRRLVLAAVECAVSIHAPAWGATGKRTV